MEDKEFGLPAAAGAFEPWWAERAFTCVGQGLRLSTHVANAINSYTWVYTVNTNSDTGIPFTEAFYEDDTDTKVSMLMSQFVGWITALQMGFPIIYSHKVSNQPATESHTALMLSLSKQGASALRYSLPHIDFHLRSNKRLTPSYQLPLSSIRCLRDSGLSF